MLSTLCLWLCLCIAPAVEIALPSVALSGVPIMVSGKDFPANAPVQLRFVDSEGREVAVVDAQADANGGLEHSVRLEQTGALRCVWRAGEASGASRLRVIPAWWSLLPPIVAIGLALLLRQVVLALAGKDAIAIARKMMGATFGSKAEPGTIRGDFGVSNSFNLVHGSDSPESAARELELFFEPDELIDWTPAGLGWVYDLSKGLPE